MFTSTSLDLERSGLTCGVRMHRRDGPGEAVPMGIAANAELPWGSHICQLYRQRSHLEETFVPYLRAGLEGGECSVWLASEPFGTEEARALLRNALPDFDARERRGQLHVVDHRRWSVRGDPDERSVFRQWLAHEQEARARGWNGLRVAMSATALAHEGASAIERYEAEVHAALNGRRMVALCAYRLDDCTPDEVVELFRHHELALVRNEGGWKKVLGTPQRHSERLLAERLIATVGHELREPLHLVSLAVEYLRDHHDPRIEPVVERLRHGTERMQRLMTDLSDLSRAGFGAGPHLERTWTDAAELCRRVIAELAALHPGRDVRFSASGRTRGAWDGDRLEQVVVNLLANALSHGRDPVLVDLRDEGENQLLRIRNGGQPISAERLERVFEPFDGAGRRGLGGLGLGLYVVRQLVRAHGGEVTARSDAENGTVFEVRLPRSEP